MTARLLGSIYYLLDKCKGRFRGILGGAPGSLAPGPLSIDRTTRWAIPPACGRLEEKRPGPAAPRTKCPRARAQTRQTEGSRDSMANPQPDKIIYSMMRVSKFYGTKQVLKDISISYFYGAKIGVIGLNGSGKSSLLRIFAGVGHRVQRPGRSLSRIHGRDARAGAASGRVQDRAADRGGRGEGDRGSPRRVQPDQREIRGADVGRRDDEAHRAPGEGAGEAGPSRRVGSRFAARDGDGRPALPAGGHAR